MAADVINLEDDNYKEISYYESVNIDNSFVHGFIIKSIAYYYVDHSNSFNDEFSSTYLHRPKGPALIMYDKRGKIRAEEYFINGKRNRFDGPAIIMYDEDKNILLEHYYFGGKYLSKENWSKHPKVNVDRNLKLLNKE